MLLTPDAANKRDSWQECPYHSAIARAAGGSGKASSYALAALPLLQQLSFLPPCLPFVANESKVLGGTYGAIDFSVPLATPWGVRWLHVEVDGETHFSKPRKGSTVEQQRDADSRKDEKAWQQELMLVRLHYLDQRWWGSRLQLASRLARRRARMRFILYTRSYRQLGLHCKIQTIQKVSALP